MSLITMNAVAMDCFDAICKAVAARGRGLTLSEIGDAGALSRELSSPDPNTERLEALRARLGLEPSEVDRG